MAALGATMLESRPGHDTGDEPLVLGRESLARTTDMFAYSAWLPRMQKPD